ncbi:MAG: hypothetical protein AB1558_00775 [Thermodesulfobacteriota bacterium]
MKDPGGSKLSDDILNEALAQERIAQDFYARMAARCQIAFVRELMETLEDEASKHIKLIENMRGQIGLGKRAAGGTGPGSAGAPRSGKTA